MICSSVVLCSDLQLYVLLTAAVNTANCASAQYSDPLFTSHKAPSHVQQGASSRPAGPILTYHRTRPSSRYTEPIMTSYRAHPRDPQHLPPPRPTGPLLVTHRTTPSPRPTGPLLTDETDQMVSELTRMSCCVGMSFPACHLIV